MSKRKNNQVKSKRPSAANYEQFVKLWRTSKSVGDVAKALNIKPNTASAIANKLRKKGVKLHKFARRTPQPVDIEKLNRIIASKKV